MAVVVVVVVRDGRSLGIAVIPTRSHFAFRHARQSFRLDFVIFGNGISQECLTSTRGSIDKTENTLFFKINLSAYLSSLVDRMLYTIHMYMHQNDSRTIRHDIQDMVVC